MGGFIEPVGGQNTTRRPKVGGVADCGRDTPLRQRVYWFQHRKRRGVGMDEAVLFPREVYL